MYSRFFMSALRQSRVLLQTLGGEGASWGPRRACVPGKGGRGGRGGFRGGGARGCCRMWVLGTRRRKFQVKELILSRGTSLPQTTWQHLRPALLLCNDNERGNAVAAA